MGYYGTGYTNLGYYQNSDQTLNLPRRDGSSNLVAGDIIYKDMNGDGFIDGADQWRIGKTAFRAATMVYMPIFPIKDFLPISYSRGQLHVTCILKMWYVDNQPAVIQWCILISWIIGCRIIRMLNFRE